MARIEICGDCEEPMIFTMVIPGAEYFCPNCKNATGMFLGNSETVESTPDLEAKYIKQKQKFEKWKADRKPKDKANDQ
jgi:hypothetical protein